MRFQSKTTLENSKRTILIYKGLKSGLSKPL